MLHLAFGVKNYWMNKVCAFDGVIVLSSIMEKFMSDAGGGAVTALRAFRLMRIFKLAKKWTSFRIMLKAIVATLMEMGNFSVLLLLMMFVFSLMGMEFFANTFKFDGDGMRVQECPPGPP